MVEALATLVLGPRVPPGKRPDVPPDAIPGDVVLREGKFLPWIGGKLSRMQRPAAAVTLGRTIILNPEAELTALLLTHELAHVRQWQADLFFPIRYGIAALRYGYDNNPYEVEARALASAEWPTTTAEEMA